MRAAFMVAAFATSHAQYMHPYAVTNAPVLHHYASSAYYVHHYAPAVHYIHHYAPVHSVIQQYAPEPTYEPTYWPTAAPTSPTVAPTTYPTASPTTYHKTCYDDSECDSGYCVVKSSKDSSGVCFDTDEAHSTISVKVLTGDKEEGKYYPGKSEDKEEEFMGNLPKPVTDLEDAENCGGEGQPECDKATVNSEGYGVDSDDDNTYSNSTATNPAMYESGNFGDKCGTSPVYGKGDYPPCYDGQYCNYEAGSYGLCAACHDFDAYVVELCMGEKNGKAREDCEAKCTPYQSTESPTKAPTYYAPDNNQIYDDQNDQTYDDQNDQTNDDQNDQTYDDQNDQTYDDQNDQTNDDQNDQTYDDQNDQTYETPAPTPAPRVVQYVSAPARPSYAHHFHYFPTSAAPVVRHYAPQPYLQPHFVTAQQQQYAYAHYAHYAQPMAHPYAAAPVYNADGVLLPSHSHSQPKKKEAAAAAERTSTVAVAAGLCAVVALAAALAVVRRWSPQGASPVQDGGSVTLEPAVTCV